MPDEIDAEMSEVSEKDKNVLVYWIGFGAALIIALIIIFLILSGMPRSTIEKAKHYHKLGEDAYNRGDIEQADEYYDLARKHRERAKKS